MGQAGAVRRVRRAAPQRFLLRPHRGAGGGEVVEFELEQRATAIVAPYLYAHSPDDPAFTASLQLLLATRRQMSRNAVNLPLIAVFCGGWKQFAREDAWGKGVDRFLANALDVQPQSLAMCLTPVGAASDGYAKTARIFLPDVGSMQAA